MRCTDVGELPAARAIARPVPCVTSPAGLPQVSATTRKRAYPMREVVNAICYVLRGGIAWRLMPDTFPPWHTVYRWFARLRDDGTWETINHHLVMRDRERTGREASPTAAVMDSQSVQTTESGGIRGYDGGKKIKDRKRHALVDTDGRALKLQAHAGDIQDRGGAGPLLRASRPSWPFVQPAYAERAIKVPRPGSKPDPGRLCAGDEQRHEHEQVLRPLIRPHRPQQREPGRAAVAELGLDGGEAPRR